MFQLFPPSSSFLEKSPVLSLVAVEQREGVVLDIGCHSSTNTVRHSETISGSTFAGRMTRLLEGRGFRVNSTTARAIDENHSFLAPRDHIRVFTDQLEKWNDLNQNLMLNLVLIQGSLQLPKERTKHGLEHRFFLNRNHFNKVGGQKEEYDERCPSVVAPPRIF